MTIEDREVEEAMASLLTTAPPSLAPGVLAEVGLADRSENGLGAFAEKLHAASTLRERVPARV